MNFASGFTYVNKRQEEDVDNYVAVDELKESLAEVLDDSDDCSSSTSEAEVEERVQANAAARPRVQKSKGLISSLLGAFSSSSSSNNKQKPKKEKKKRRRKPRRSASVLQREAQAGKAIHREADTNVVSIEFGSLAQDSRDIFAGDAVFCSSCNAVLSRTSKLVPEEFWDEKDGDTRVKKKTQSDVTDAESAPAGDALDDIEIAPAAGDVKQASEDASAEDDSQELSGTYVWKCEFCGTVNNDIELDDEEIPKDDARDYVLEPATQDDDKKQQDGGLTIFCVDVSGSMCVTTEVPGNVQIKGVKPPSDDIMQFAEQRLMPRTNTTWVSRLQCMQAAIDQQLHDWKRDNPNMRVGLVTFNREVTIIGDGTQPVELIAGDKLSNQEKVQSIGSSHKVEKSISETCDALSQKVWALEPTGATALGPAMLSAVQMASGTAGSRVVICTDGLANVGLGDLDQKDNENKERVEQWYESVGNLAKLGGVTVSVISIEGDECALEALGTVCEITGGDVTKVNPLDLTKNFSSFLEKPVIATNVSCTFMLHQGLKFRNEDEATHKLTREVGNVTEDSEVLFEYGLKSKDELKVLEGLTELPFQVQINFTKLNGMKCMRVLSKSQPITDDREKAEATAKIDLLAANIQQQSARLAEVGDLLESRAHNRVWGRLMQRQAKRSAHNRGVYNQWNSNMAEFDDMVGQQQQQLAASSDMFSMGGMGAPPARSRAQKKKRAKGQRRDRDYAVMRNMKVSSSKSYRS